MNAARGQVRACINLVLVALVPLKWDSYTILDNLMEIKLCKSICISMEHMPWHEPLEFINKIVASLPMQLNLLMIPRHKTANLMKMGGVLYGIATAHHAKDAVINNAMDKKEEQRRVWVPFHFIPGAEGASFSEKLLCIKDSPVANEMMQHHVDYAINGASFGLELLGIGAHVYMDTFSHYGFSGISSEYNAVDGDSFEYPDIKDKQVESYITAKLDKFFTKYGTKCISCFGEQLSGALGHGAVATFPDRPFLH